MMVIKQKQPMGLYILFFAEILVRFSYWGIQSLLVLYLTEHYHFSYLNAYHLYGSFTALTFIFSIVGGYYADQIFGFKKTLTSALVLVLLGNIILTLPDTWCIYLGLSVVAYGSGLFFPNNSNILGNLYEKNDLRRDSAFALYYVGTNIGALTGPFIYGIIARQYNWHIAFIITSLLVCIFLIIFYRHKLQASNKRISTSKNKQKLFVCISIAIIALTTVTIRKFEVLGIVLNIIGILSILYIVYKAKELPHHQFRTTLYLLAMMIFPLLFFAVAFQVGNSLLVFAREYVDRGILSWSIPTSTFASLEPAFILITAPLFAKIWQQLVKWNISLSLLTKTMIGITLTALSFAAHANCVSYAMHQNHISPLWLFSIGYFLLACGEVCIMLPIINAISANAPQPVKGMLMGMLFLSLAFSAYLSSIIATFTIPQHTLHADKLVGYYSVYIHIFWLMISIATIMFIGKIFYNMSKNFRSV